MVVLSTTTRQLSLVDSSISASPRGNPPSHRPSSTDSTPVRPPQEDRAATARSAMLANSSPLMQLPDSTLSLPIKPPPVCRPGQGFASSPLSARSSPALLLISGSKPPTPRINTAREAALGTWTTVAGTGHSAPASQSTAFVGDRRASIVGGPLGSGGASSKAKTVPVHDLGACLGAVVDGDFYFITASHVITYSPDGDRWDTFETKGRPPHLSSGPFTTAVPRKSKRVLVIGPQHSASPPAPHPASRRASVASALFDKDDDAGAIHVFDVGTCGWERHSVGRGVSRIGHTASLVDGHRVFVVGGRAAPDPARGADAPEELLPDVWAVDSVTMRGAAVAMAGQQPPRRVFHTAAVVAANIYVFGGLIGGICVQDLLRLDTSRNQWSNPKASGEAPLARSHSSCSVLAGGSILFWGGQDHFGKVYGDVHVLDTETMTWSRPALEGTIPSPGWGALVLTGKWEERERLLMWGWQRSRHGGEREGRLHMLTLREGGLRPVASAGQGEQAAATRRLDFKPENSPKMMGLTDAPVDTRRHIAAWDGWMWGLDELIAKLGAVERGEADAYAMGDPRELAAEVVASIKSLRRDAGVLVADLTSMMLVSELPVEAVVCAHEARGDADYVVAMRRAQMIEAGGRAAERRCLMVELGLLAECERSVVAAMDGTRSQAVEELLEAMAEQGDKPDPSANVIVCHRHGARKPTDGDMDSESSFIHNNPSSSRPSSASKSRMSMSRTHSNASNNASNLSSSPAQAPNRPMGERTGQISRPPSRTTTPRGPAPPIIPPTVAKEDKWGVGIYTHSNQLLAHTMLTTKRRGPLPPSRGEDFLKGDESDMGVMERAARELERAGGGGKLRLFTMAAGLVRDMHSTRMDGTAGVRAVWRERREEIEKLLKQREGEVSKMKGLITSLQARLDKFERENLELNKRAATSEGEAKGSLERLRELEQRRREQDARHQAVVIGRWRVFRRRISMKIMLGSATKYLVTKNNSKEMQSMRRAAAADGSQEPPVSPLSLKGLMAENDRLTLRLVAASEIKVEIASIQQTLANFSEALTSVSEAVSQGKGGGGAAAEEAVEALMDMTKRVEDVSKKLAKKVVPDDGFAQHISHRLAAEKTRSKVGQQCIKSLQAQVEEAAKDKHILRQKITCLENLVAAEASLRLRAEKQRDDVQALQERTVLEMHRQAGLPKGLMGEALQEALKGRDERLVALESIVAEESVRAMEREEKLQLSEMERRDMQGAFMLVFEHLKEGAGSGAQAWLKRFSGRAWFARAQVQAREAYDERGEVVKRLEEVRGTPRASVKFETGAGE